MSGKIAIEKKIIAAAKLAVNQAIKQNTLPSVIIPEIEIEVPKDEKFGDFSLNIAMQLAKPMQKKPRDIAEIIANEITGFEPLIEKADIAGPGFINITLDPIWLYEELTRINELGNEYGKLTLEKPKSINVEYVSGNPTGPLHIGNARGGAIGDVLANIYQCAGWNVTKEFYLNDAGNQVIKFGESLSARYMQLFDPSYPFPDDGYKGVDISRLAEAYRDENGDSLKDAQKNEREKTLMDYALTINISNMRKDLEKYGIIYDVWFSESTLHNSDAIKDIVKLLSDNGATYEKDGALWFRATDYDCEKDEVLLRTNGIPTYYTADIAYHYNKLVIRGFDLAVNVWGADHHGHVHRLKMALKAAGINPDRLKVVLMQMVCLMRDGEPVRLSKRNGEIVTLRDLIDDVSVDAARFIFNYNNATTHMNFDMDLAVKESNENPVFYVQYAHARIRSILRNITAPQKDYDLSVLTDKTEVSLMKKLADFSKEITLAARDFDPSRMTKYAYDLATHFHSFYNACRVKNDDENLMGARLSLVRASGIVLKNTLNVLGVSAPEQM
ncbi:MAG: arginine--tRNA ligase [Anaerofustis sp.]